MPACLFEIFGPGINPLLIADPAETVEAERKIGIETMGKYLDGLKQNQKCPANAPLSLEETEWDDGSITYEIYRRRRPGSNMVRVDRFEDRALCEQRFQELWELEALCSGPD